MGVRVYVPQLGRFLQVDPVVGGSANDYDYANQDPINTYDLDGRCPVCVAVVVIAARIAVRAAPAAARVAVAGGRAIVQRVRPARPTPPPRPSPPRITGYSRHGLERAIGRDGGAGVSPRAILDAVRGPTRVSPGRTPHTQKFVGRDATVVLSRSGRIVTTWATNRNGVRRSPR
jgi:hypothetical protein